MSVASVSQSLSRAPPGSLIHLGLIFDVEDQPLLICTVDERPLFIQFAREGELQQLEN